MKCVSKEKRLAGREREGRSRLHMFDVITTDWRRTVHGVGHCDSWCYAISNMTMDLEQETRIRYRRTKSVSRAEDLQKEEARIRRLQPDKP
jgi:hypothetical protein